MTTIRFEVSLKTVTLVVLLAMMCLAPVALAAVTGTASRWNFNIAELQGASGANGFSMKTDGLRGDFGSGTDDFIASNGTNLIVGTGAGAGYVASAIPIPLAAVYVNNIIAVFTFGGGKLPAHPFTVTDISYDVRASGTGGTTNNTFQVSDGANTCNCTFACNQATGAQIAACVNGAGTGCVYAANAALTYGFSAIGDCVVPTDLLGNVSVRGKWQ